MGEINRAYWLKIVKEHGQAGGSSYISKQTGKSYMLVKEALDFLIGQRYVQMKGKGGRAGYTYELTSFGHRYLEEHQDELQVDEPLPIWIEAPGDQPRHAVPVEPLPKTAPVSDLATRVAEPTNEPVPVAAATSDLAEQIKQAALPLLYQKAGGLVSIKDLVEYLTKAA